MKHLIIGCSYIRDANRLGILEKYFGNDTKVIGQDGCGNDFISHQTLNELQYEHAKLHVLSKAISRVMRSTSLSTGVLYAFLSSSLVYILLL